MEAPGSGGKDAPGHKHPAHRRSAKAIVTHMHEKIKAESALISKLRRQEQLMQRRAAVQPGEGSVPAGAAAGSGVGGGSEQLQAEIRQAAREGAMRLLQESGLAITCPAPSAHHHTHTHTHTQPHPLPATPSASGQGQGQGQGQASPASASVTARSQLTRGAQAPSPFTPPVATAGGVGLQHWFGGPEDDPGGQLSDEEIVRLLEEQLYTSLIAEELEVIEGEEQRQVEAMAEDYQRWQQQEREQQAGCGEGERVLCPVCGQALLVQLHGVVACPLERWQLDVRVESLTLDSLRQRLAAAYESHAQGGCSGSLRFSVETMFGATQLMARCHTCSAMQIIF